MTKYFLFLFVVLSGVISLRGQETAKQEANFATFDCNITQTKQKLRRKFFASTTPLHLRVDNSDFVFATLQFGKRKKKIYMYLQILEKNVCIKKDKVLDIYFRSGEVLTFKNDFDLNCDGYFAKQLKKKDFEKLRENHLQRTKIYTYDKNYELYLSEADNQIIDDQLACLANYKVKKTDEVKVKKSKRSKKAEKEMTETNSITE